MSATIVDVQHPPWDESNPHPDSSIHRLLFKGHVFSSPDEMMEAAKSVDLDLLVHMAAEHTVAKNRFSSLLNAALVRCASNEPAYKLFARTEAYVAKSGDAFSMALRDAVAIDWLDGSFYQLDSHTSVDFDEFDARLLREIRLIQPDLEVPQMKCGIAPEKYWSLMLDAAGPVFDEVEGSYVSCAVGNPDLWAAIVNRALDSGLTADSMIDEDVDVPGQRVGLERFRDAIERRAGATCGAIFDAINIQREMTALIDSRAPWPMPTGKPRRASL